VNTKELEELVKTHGGAVFKNALLRYHFQHAGGVDALDQCIAESDDLVVLPVSHAGGPGAKPNVVISRSVLNPVLMVIESTPSSPLSSINQSIQSTQSTTTQELTSPPTPPLLDIPQNAVNRPKTAWEIWRASRLELEDTDKK